VYPHRWNEKNTYSVSSYPVGHRARLSWTRLAGHSVLLRSRYARRVGIPGYRSGNRRTAPRIPVLVAIGLLFTVWLRWPDRLSEALGALALALFVYCAFASPIERVLRDAATAVFCLIYTGFTLVALPALRSSEDGRWLVTFLSAWSGLAISSRYTWGGRWGGTNLLPGLAPIRHGREQSVRSSAACW